MLCKKNIKNKKGIRKMSDQLLEIKDFLEFAKRFDMKIDTKSDMPLHIVGLYNDRKKLSFAKGYIPIIFSINQEFTIKDYGNYGTLCLDENERVFSLDLFTDIICKESGLYFENKFKFLSEKDCLNEAKKCLNELQKKLNKLYKKQEVFNLRRL